MRSCNSVIDTGGVKDTCRLTELCPPSWAGGSLARPSGAELPDIGSLPRPLLNRHAVHAALRRVPDRLHLIDHLILYAAVR